MAFATRVASVMLALQGVSSLSTRQIEGIADAPSTSDYIRRNYHQVAVLDDHLYIYGGEFTASKSGKNTGNKSQQVNYTLTVDLSTSWALEDVEVKKSIAIDTTFGKRNTLWQDPSSPAFYTVGGDRGWNGVAVSASPFRKFTSDGNGGGSWSIPQPSNPGAFNAIVSTAATSATTCSGLGLYTGGYANAWTTPNTKDTVKRFTPGLITYNITSREWANQTMVNFADGFDAGELSCIPSYGTDGLVLFLGGETGVSPRTPISFTNISLYDPAANSWYWQTASGEAPKESTHHCAVVVKGEESTEIFMYGGKGESGSVSGDVYILTIPGFQWFKAPAGYARHGNKCVVAGNRQMISVGGLSSTNEDTMWTQRDPWPQGIGIFDMSALSWSDKFNVNAAKYTSPDVVKTWYKDGGLESVYWSSSATEELFAQKKSDEKDTKGSGQQGNEGDTGDSTKGPTPTKTHVGAIAGGVVGGVAALALVGLAIWYILRRRRQGQESSGQSGLEANSKNPGNHEPTLEYYGPQKVPYTKAELDTEPPKPVYELGQDTDPRELSGEDTPKK